ncbi:hypothetical protein VHUM_00783 [Vanrija humicola]|uniref:Alpha/beta hydrolase fold-3 domain-containing protein n=1 Tax=Vanrija humicola TaxID=5417 RepID=A0A7D8Z906_VANHU|nr:hypothetical protein VHUM_00783 [Vanrija humicola]
MSATTFRNPDNPHQPGPLAALLKSYTSSHPLRSPSPLPASSRHNPKLAQRQAPPTSASPLLWTLPTWIAFVQFIAAKGLFIFMSLLKHFLFGPQRKSWGYRMTFITSFMRNVANYSDFADVNLIRRLISITYLIPLPADAVVTPITFLVPKRKAADACRGFLRDLDLEEVGTRELKGEWVVGIDVWKRLKSERRAKWHAEMKRRSLPGPSRLRGSGESATGSNPTSPVTARSHRRRDSESINGNGSANGSGEAQGSTNGRSTPEPELEGEEALPMNRRERVIYYIHGGAYYVGNAATHRLVTVGVSKACNARVFAITYRLAPEAAFPLPLHDVLHGYLRLLAPPLSIPPESIVIAGDSAGGGLSLALCMYLRDNGYQMPSGLVLMSPWVDLTMSCGSWDDNADSDVVPRPAPDDHLNPVGSYLGPEGVARYITHPYASPLFGDLSNLPPMLIQSGDSEVLRDEITLLAHKATMSGVEVTHELYQDMVHVFQMFTWLPATHAAINSIGRWVRQTLPRIEWEQRQAEAEVAEGGEDNSPTPTAPGDQPAASQTPVSEHPPTPSEGVVPRGARTPGARTPGTRTPRRTPHVPVLDIDALPRVPSYSRQSSYTGRRTPGAHHTELPATTPPARAHRSFTSLHPLSPSHHQPEHDPFLANNVPAPRLRRANTTQPQHTRSASGGASSPNQPQPQPQASSSSSSSSPLATMRRRRQTTASLSMAPQAEAAAAAAASQASSPHLHPTSPSGGTHRRLRAPTLSYPSTPTTRTRSVSHLDIHQLVDDYIGSGAANETVVYTPGGEIRSVCVLGDEDDEQEELMS